MPGIIDHSEINFLIWLKLRRGNCRLPACSILSGYFSKNGQIGTRDISFLHDHETPLAITSGENGNHDSLLPEEFQIIRSEKVAGLSVRPTQYSTHLTETDPKGKVLTS